MTLLTVPHVGCPAAITEVADKAVFLWVAYLSEHHDGKSKVIFDVTSSRDGSLVRYSSCDLRIKAQLK